LVDDSGIYHFRKPNKVLEKRKMNIC